MRIPTKQAISQCSEAVQTTYKQDPKKLKITDKYLKLAKRTPNTDAKEQSGPKLLLSSTNLAGAGDKTTCSDETSIAERRGHHTEATLPPLSHHSREE